MVLMANVAMGVNEHMLEDLYRDRERERVISVIWCAINAIPCFSLVLACHYN